MTSFDDEDDASCTFGNFGASDGAGATAGRFAGGKTILLMFRGS